jgi:serine-type D-Ala-D-Ala carboxypeptidase (penicillin-binding protein 5/6)
MIKRFVAILFVFLSVIGLAEGAAVLTAQSSILMDSRSKKVIYSLHSRTKFAPASTVKIMTALVVFNKAHLKKNVLVSNFAASMEPSKIYIAPGESYRTEDLLKALLMSSANDVAVALAESVAGSEKKFAAMMTETARGIGAVNTNFKNASGLPAKGQYSTAHDMALIMSEAMKYPALIDIMKTKHSEIKEIKSGRIIKLKNHNKSLWNDKPYSLIGKTGYTINAGQCFAGYIQYGKRRKVIVVMLKGRKLWPDLAWLAERGRL